MALLLGGVIGFERQWRQRTAGLRRNALVAIGTSGFVVFSTTITGENNAKQPLGGVDVETHYSVEVKTSRIPRKSR